MLKLTRRRLLIIAVLGALGVWLAASASVAWFFTRRSTAPFAQPPPNVGWAQVEAHRLNTSDGQEIGVWLVHGDPRKAGVLLLHGNSSSRREMLPVMEWLAQRRFTSLAISLRAHGDSTGDVNDFGWSARHDVVAAVGFLQHECPGQPIYIVGRSLGAAAAIFAAEELNGRIAGYFLEQPYKDLDSAVWNRLQNRLPPGLDWLGYLGLRLWAPVFLPVDPDLVSPYEHVADIPAETPIVFITGSADRRARLDDVTDLFNRVQSHARLVVFQGAAHEALDRNNPQLYRESLFRLLNERP